MVRVDGTNAVLMTILKAGSVSTLDVINGVKALLPKLRETLAREPEARRDRRPVVLRQCGGQFGHFRGRGRRGADRPDDPDLSRQLALDADHHDLDSAGDSGVVAALSAIGETINVMTLGGLALAVGILVDDATVTIENINWHLEQGKDIEVAIMDGARQIVIPATVSLLCICIVFVPMFSLGGVAGYLFRPMAEAVVFALIASYVLSRTLVNTMARYLLANQALHDNRRAARPPTRNPLVLFQRGFERRFEATRDFYRRLLVTALAARGHIHCRLSRRRRRFVRACPVSGTELLSARRQHANQACMYARRPGRGSRSTALICDGVEAAIRRIIPPEALGPIVDNIGLPVSGINSTYNNSGTVGPADADILITSIPPIEARRMAT